MLWFRTYMIILHVTFNGFCEVYKAFKILPRLQCTSPGCKVDYSEGHEKVLGLAVITDEGLKKAQGPLVIVEIWVFLSTPVEKQQFLVQ